MRKRLMQGLYPVLPLGPQEQERPQSNRLLLAGAFFCVLIASFIFLYSDLMDMAVNSSLLLKSIFHGKFFEFYTYSLEHSTSQFPANYDFPMYLIFAVWNLPMALLFDFQVNGVMILWLKLFVLLCVTLCSLLMYKIYGLFGRESRLSAGSFLLLMLSSPLVFLGEFVAGQYDCISMILILAGLYEYLRGREGRFLLYFFLAVPIKSFALFLFLPLLVYREKKLLKILLKSIIVFAIPLCCKLLFRADPAYSFLLGAQNRDAAELLMSASVQIGSGAQGDSVALPLFMLLLMLTCFSCYFRPYDRERVLLIAAAVYTSFILLNPIRSYWVFLAEPFLLLLITTREKLFRVNYLLHTVGAICGSVFYLYSHWIYNTTTITTQLLLQSFDLPAVVRYGSFENFVRLHGWEVYMPLLHTVMFGCFSAILLLCGLNEKKLKLDSKLSPWFLSRIRCLSLAGILGIMMFVTCDPCPLPAVDTLCYAAATKTPYVRYDAGAEESAAEQQEASEARSQSAPVQQAEILARWDQDLAYYDSDLSSGAVIEQPFELTEDRTISEIWFQFCNLSSSRMNRVRLRISLVDRQSGTVLGERILGAALIPNGEICQAQLPKLRLSRGSYLIRITNVPLPDPVPFGNIPIYILCNAEAGGVEPATVNGKPAQYPVCVCVN